MAKVKVVNNNLDQNLNGTNFNNTASQTVFSFGRFQVTSNFDGRKYVDYSNTLSSFVRPVTLETMGVSDVQSQIIYEYTTNAVLNLDKSDLNTFIRFGSAYEFLRVTIEKIILEYPASLFLNSQMSRNINLTYFDYVYDIVTNTASFKIPMNCIVNTFGLVYNYGNTSVLDNKELRNLNLSYDKYVVWTAEASDNCMCNVIGFTGNTSGRNYLMIKTNGNPFSFTVSGNTSPVDFHIKPNNFVFEEFRALLNEYEKYIVSARQGTDGFKFTIKDPTLLENGTIAYSDTSLLWSTGDKYNIDINTPSYQRFLESILTIGAKYDKIKTDLIARFLTPASLKTYDLTEEGKMTKLLRIYGREFDQVREFIDSLVYINKVTYDKINNIPDQLIKNMSRTFGWDYFSLVNENELVETFLTIDEKERNLNEDLLPAEIDIELWRRILLNTNYFWKSKGTREAIKSMFLLIGIPEPFINITEYVYTVDGRINPNTVTLSQQDFPSNSLPYDADGYPKAPLETPDFYFQVSGDTDSGQAYMDVFRMAGFNLMKTVDNKKSWVEEGAITRIDDTTPQYYQADSRLVLNTKEVDVALDTARGIEYDVYRYIQKDFAANSSGYTLPYTYVNISLGFSGKQTTFTLPYNPSEIQGDLEVRFNGILMNGAKLYTGGTSTINETFSDGTDGQRVEYIVSGNTIMLNPYLSVSAESSSYRRDVIQATLITSGGTSPVSGITVQYIVTRIKPNIISTVIPLPSYPRGDVQVTINGIALTKGTNQFTADYIVDPSNSISGTSQIIIQNPELVAFLASNPDIQITYVEVEGSNDISARSEVVRVDSFNSSKIYYNAGANKYVYKLNYKANSTKDIKVLIDGIALEPNMDYSINVMNPYEIFLPNGIKYGTVISVYYLVGGNDLFNPVVSNIFGVGDISKLSFLEFIELIQKRMINARNRQTVSDFKGGWYPALLNVYVQYLKRANLPDDNPLQSNGYTFQNLYSFLSKYNAFFQRFVDQLLSATIILKKSGLLVRNTVFTKQKFMYRRGVNVPSGNTTTKDLRGNPLLQYYGDDGSMFVIDQNYYAPAPPSAVAPSVATNEVIGVTQTTAGVSGVVINSGGATVTSRGFAYGLAPNPTVAGTKTVNGSGVGPFNTTLTGLAPNTSYFVRAYAINSAGIGYGANKGLHTSAIVIPPSLKTKQGTTTTTTISNTGGYDITGYTNVQYYAMQYRVGTSGAWSQTSPTSGPLVVNNFTITITGLAPSTQYTYRAYMIVSGTTYYGNILTGTTVALPLSLPTVITSGITTITTTGATGGGYVTSDGNATVTTRGVAYGTGLNPTIAGTKTINGSGTGSFTSQITGLSDDTTYYARAYATNSQGTAYGDTVSFVTLPQKDVNLELYSSTGTDGTIYREERYCITTTPPMVAGECFCICLGLPLFVDSDLVNDGSSYASYDLYCKGAAMPGYVLYWNPPGDPPNSFCSLFLTGCSPDTLSYKNFVFCYGDSIRLIQKANTKIGCLGKGGTNSCACIKGVSSISGSGSFEVGTTCCKTCAYSG